MAQIVQRAALDYPHLLSCNAEAIRDLLKCLWLLLLANVECVARETSRAVHDRLRGARFDPHVVGRKAVPKPDYPLFQIRQGL